MTNITTTKRVFKVEEDYETIKELLINSDIVFLELTELIEHHSQLPPFETNTFKRNVLIQKQHIVEVLPYAKKA